MRDYSDVLARFRGVVGKPGKADSWMAFCPLHKGGMERHRSLSLWVGTRGQLMLHCFACGRENKEHILSSVGLRMAELFEDSGTRMQGGADMTPYRKLVAHFTYTDEQGKPLYRVFRYDPKDFLQGRYEPGGKPPKHLDHPDWANYRAGLNCVRRVLYRLPEVANEPDKNRPVFVVEGEGKVEMLREMGFLATCNVGGAGMGWVDCYSDPEKQDQCYSCPLAGRNVIVLPDNNPPGFRHANGVVGSLVRHAAKTVRYATLPVKENEDVGDWVRAGGTRDDLIQVCLNFPPYTRVIKSP